jgi:hypothetical protein
MGASQRASQTQRLVVMSYAGIGQIILFGGGDVGGGGGAFEPGLVCAKAMGSNDIAIGAAVNANAATIITTISKYIIDMMPKMIQLSVMHKNRLDYLTL